MAISYNYIVIIYIFLIVNCPVTAQELCNDIEVKRISTEDVNQNKLPKKEMCNEYFTYFMDSNELKKIKYAKILYEEGWNEDVYTYKYIYVLRLPDEKIVRLNKLTPTTSIPLEIYSKLNYDVAKGGGLVRTNENVFINKKYFSHKGGKICLNFEMKYPFSGKFINCDGQIKIIEEIWHSHGTLSIKDAELMVCSEVFNDLKIPCGNNQTIIIGFAASRDQNDSLIYTIQSRSTIRSHPELTCTERTPSGWITSTPVEHDVRTYSINAVDGKVVLLKHDPSSLEVNDCNDNFK